MKSLNTMKKTNHKSEYPAPVPGCIFCKQQCRQPIVFHGIITGIVIGTYEDSDDFDKRLVGFVGRPDGHRPFIPRNITDLDRAINSVLTEIMPEYELISTDNHDDSAHPFLVFNLKKRY